MYSSGSKSTALVSLLLVSSVAAAATNKPPVISGVPATTVQVQKTYRFFAAAKDPEGAQVYFSIQNKPSWAWFDARLGILGGEPQAAGTSSNIIISASDGTNTVSYPAFSITALSAADANKPAKPANVAPTISGAAAGSVSAGTTYSFQPSALDANGDKLTFSIANKPVWATFDAASGRMTGTPQAAQVGTYAGIAISVSDGVATATLPAFSVSVAKPANRAPTISGVPATSVSVSKTYRFFATASDADGDALTFSIANKPSWAWFDAKQGILGGEAPAAMTYSNIVISVSDGKSTVSLPAFSITAVGADNGKPVLGGSPQRSVTAGTAYVFQPAASDPNGDMLAFSISNKPSWATFSTATGRLAGTPKAGEVATYGNIVISVSDGKDAVALPAFAITVDAAATASSGSAALSWTPPTENVDGSALVNLAGYRLYYGSSAEQLDQVIEIKNPGVADYVIDNLNAGKYYFAIKAFSSNGAESTQSAVASKVIQ
jgi:hypothetical protein